MILEHNPEFAAITEAPDSIKSTLLGQLFNDHSIVAAIINPSISRLPAVKLVNRKGTRFYSVSSRAIDTAQQSFLCIFTDITSTAANAEIYSLLQSTIGDGVWDLHLDDNTIYYSERWKNMFGYANYELENSQETWNRLIFPEDRVKTEELLKRIFSGERSSVEMLQRYRHKNGSTVYVHMRCCAVYDHAMRPVRILGSHTDVTEREEFSLRMQEQDFLLNEMSAMAGIGGWSLDIESQALSWTKEVFQIFEVSEEFPVTVTEAIKFYPPEFRPALEKALNRAIENGVEYDLELQVLTATGRRKWVHTRGKGISRRDGRVIKIAGTIQDITEKKASQEQIQRLSQIVEESPDYIAFARLDGQILYCNRAMQELLGQNIEKQEYNLHSSRITTQPELILNTAIPAALQHGIWRGETVITGQDRRSLMVSQLIICHYDHNGLPAFLSTVLRDISQRVEAEQKLAESNALLTTLIEKMPIGFELFDEHGISRQINPAMQQVFDAYQDIVNTKDSKNELYPVNSAGILLQEYIQQALNGTVILNQEIVLLQENALAGPEERILGITIYPVYKPDNSMNAVVALVSDMTGLRRNEQKIAVSEMKLKAVFDSSSDAFVMFDKSLNIMLYNKGAQQLLRMVLSKELVEGEYLPEIINPQSIGLNLHRNKLYENCKKALQDQYISYEVPSYDVEGEIRGWFTISFGPIHDQHGNIFAGIIKIQNITARKLAEQTLALNYSTLQGVLESSDNKIYAVDRQYRYTAFNQIHARRMKEIFNVDIIHGISIIEIIEKYSAEAAVKLRECLNRCLDGEQFMITDTFSFATNVSTVYEINYNPIYDEKRSVVGVAVMYRDILKEYSQNKKCVKASRIYARLYRPSMMWYAKLIAMVVF